MPTEAASNGTRPASNWPCGGRSSQGGGSKDTWVIDDGTLDDAPAESASREPAERSLSHAVAANFSKRYNAPTSHDDRIVQQERQQQQSPSPISGRHSQQERGC